jgi:cell division protein FtsZ
MLEIHRQISLISSEAESLKIKIFGLGGAGSNALDRLVLDGLDHAEAVAVNTDVQALTASVSPQKIQIGRQTTRGLGAGGDPELGLAAAEEASAELSAGLEGANLVFLCVGLGGGTGSGAAPLLAALAREHGALVVAFATMPFAFEGRRRTAQAAEALEALREAADIVVCFENDRMGESVSPQAGIHQAFAASDTTISQSVRAVSELFKRPGLMRIGFDDLSRVLSGRHARCLFGHGESESDNRANEALARALKSPLMERGRLLDEADALIVNVVGGANMTLNEVQILMEELNRHVGEHTQVFFGTAVDPKAGNRMSVTIISSLGDRAVAPAPPQVFAPVKRVAPPQPRIEPAPAPVAPVEPELVEALAEVETYGHTIEPEFSHESVAEPAAEIFPEAEPAPAYEVVSEAIAELVEAAPTPQAAELESPFYADAPEPEPEPEPIPEPIPEPVAVLPTARPARTIPRHMRSTPEPQLPMDLPPAKMPQQESLPFEPVSRGRFEKSEPTIVDGQDLDVPTFMRRNVRIK